MAGVKYFGDSKIIPNKDIDTFSFLRKWRPRASQYLWNKSWDANSSLPSRFSKVVISSAAASSLHFVIPHLHHSNRWHRPAKANQWNFLHLNQIKFNYNLNISFLMEFIPLCYNISILLNIIAVDHNNYWLLVSITLHVLVLLMDHHHAQKYTFKTQLSMQVEY